ncbi:MAG: AbrB/MazE/SpoVT family DNA-binding domain-containing protein [Acidobacteria bacterium]|nr:AbrB/MazE/SpoVT family DNA-binding domain-containing protein [Acidobacteriota bacterium]
MRSVVGERGQVTIPKPLRDRLGIRAGEILEFEADDGRLIARKASVRDPVDSAFGKYPLGRPTDEVVAEMRGEYDA